MIYCSNCGARVTRKIPDGDDRARFVCESCATVHYTNPKIVAGCIPEWQGRVLLCRRAIEPRHGLWTLPAGFMEDGESTEQAAARETWEEARARVENLALYGVFSIPHISQVYMMFRAILQAEEFAPGPESLEVRLFEKHEIPWDELAFPVVKRTLEKYCNDTGSNEFGVHVEDIIRHPPRPR
ncbi:MAG: NUDIX hydrolase [Gammaproteobacteria bacterium]|nr:MAG: NUDIX hydrolase [Gammaproteobacteria bacterium]